jgi:origin recognition complex subunit 1
MDDCFNGTGPDDDGTPQEDHYELFSYSSDSESVSDNWISEGDDEVAQLGADAENPALGQDLGSVLRKATPWDDVRKKFMYLQKPNEPLLCRESEHQNVKDMLKSMLQPIDGDSNILGGVVFVAGVPGTGKTATLRIVASQLDTDLRAELKSRFPSSKSGSRPFHYLEVNALKLSSPKMVFQHLWWVINKRLRKKDFGDAAQLAKLGSLGVTAAQAQLDDFFRGKLDKKLQEEKVHRIPILLLVDEIETLMTSNQQILYTIFEWSRLPTAKLVIVGIANMLDMSSRLQQKINSRIGTNRIIFDPYKASQLLEILLSKLKTDMHFFQGEHVLDYIAKKVGASKGDARLTFEICSRSLRFAELRSLAQDPSGLNIIPVDNKIVDQVIFSMRDNARLVALQSICLHDRVWILAVLFEIGSRRSWRDQVTEAQRKIISKTALQKLDDDVTYFNMVNIRYINFCEQLSLRPQSSTALQASSQRLFQLGIFQSNWEDRTLQSAIFLKMDPEDIIKSIEADEKLNPLLESYNFRGLFGIAAHPANDM